MDPKAQYVVAGVKSWNRQVFDQIISGYPGGWHFVGKPGELTAEAIGALRPRYLFFLHWSEMVPPSIFDIWECVCFHMTDVPYGRGGSPLQNLIARGHRTTKVTALRMVADFDAGPIYLQEDLALDGTAEEIYVRAMRVSAGMIRRIIEAQPMPRPQTGTATVFKRRQPSESRIPTLGSLEKLHDFIRMLDADGYPHAFLEHEGFRFEFRRAASYHGKIVADVTITSAQGPRS